MFNDFGIEALKHFLFLTLDDDDKQSSAVPDKPQLPEEIAAAPLFSVPVRSSLVKQYDQADGDQLVFPQYALLGHRKDTLAAGQVSLGSLVYSNTAAPWSAFICGSQGSGKSHSLSCLLENCLLQDSPVGKVSAPLAGMVFHCDNFSAHSSSQICEAAYLCSAGIPVRVLVSPTNYLAMKNAYCNLPGLENVAKRISVEPMYLPLKGLNVAMMKALMGLSDETSPPLYMEVVMKILRQMALDNQGRDTFDYKRFRKNLDAESFLKGQNLPLQMRLDVLESFFEPGAVKPEKGPRRPSRTDKMWNFEPGTLTIVDLSCPFVGPNDACALFNICTSLFLKDRHKTGRVLALDEAHKFLTETSPEAVTLTNTLLSVVRQQRHLATRVLIATQEPTISPKLLDLCNLTMIHRFTSPAWFKSIKAHIAGACNKAEGHDTTERDLFGQIVRLKTGEALVFCPTALLESSQSQQTDGHQGPEVIPLGAGYAHLRVRKRVTADGGRSIITQ
ncbi:hypothetical protein N7539_000866 [Penicillium diatomitis]|uniref:Uncharacterized protein n=1 Tax=Penicillium diatomitis TaxID=2819901 RepID=A0A9W9XNC1_9EURO|nr:uncharacterized protein N7539_000866 [Penicillium diatomitis]KAJ5495750.1 hypothetical protein N7539_000866 [Penicillium diatomitis]